MRKKYKYINKRQITKHKKELIRREIEQQSWTDIFKASDVDEKVSLLHQTIENILEKHCPTERVKVRVERPPWISSFIQKLIRARNKAFVKKCPSWKLLRAVVQRRIRTSKRYYVQNSLNKACGSKTWWKHLNKLSKSRTYDHPDKLHIIENQRLHPKQLCRQLNEHFIKVRGENINITLPTYADDQEPLPESRIGEVKAINVEIFEYV
jgi:hypothetical protein